MSLINWAHYDSYQLVFRKRRDIWRVTFLCWFKPKTHFLHGSCMNTLRYCCNTQHLGFCITGFVLTRKGRAASTGCLPVCWLERRSWVRWMVGFSIEMWCTLYPVHVTQHCSTRFLWQQKWDLHQGKPGSLIPNLALESSWTSILRSYIEFSIFGDFSLSEFFFEHFQSCWDSCKPDLM